ncbi:MAG: hypothetical protein U0514_03205 [Candidatus Andersenbacteria bacterium]
MPLKPEAALTPGWIADDRGSRAKVTVDAAELDRFFSKQVAAVVPGFELRAEQVAGRTLHASLNGNQHLVVEAAPGVGRRATGCCCCGCAHQQRTHDLRCRGSQRAGSYQRTCHAARATRLRQLHRARPTLRLRRSAVDRFVDRPKLTEVEVQLAAKLLLWFSTTT